jgi:LysR family transcriptional regulator, hydrogen peroxide-inducible genes activator
MELHQLRYFCAVARAGSFTRAAEDEAVAQPTLSEAVRKLESDLGVPLFERLGRSIRLTAYGERFRPRAESILHEVATARRSIAEQASDGQGHLRVGVIPTVLPYLLASRIGSFRASHPGIDLRFVEDITPRLLEQLQRGELDVIVAALPVKNPALLCGELLREPLLLAVPRAHPLAERAHVQLADVRDEPLLLLKEGHCFRDDALRWCRRTKIRLESRFESDHLAAILPLVASGFGVAIVPAMAAAHSDCAFIPLRPSAERRIGSVRVRAHLATPAQKVFLTWLRRTARADQPGRGLKAPTA